VRTALTILACIVAGLALAFALARVLSEREPMREWNTTASKGSPSSRSLVGTCSPIRCGSCGPIPRCATGRAEFALLSTTADPMLVPPRACGSATFSVSVLS
jgi:hypothetical protein